jgi:hypothetical protein
MEEMTRIGVAARLVTIVLHAAIVIAVVLPVLRVAYFVVC